MPALSIKFHKVNISLNYDGLTIYPKYEEFKTVESIIKVACREIIVTRALKTQDQNDGENSLKEIEKINENYEKYVKKTDKEHTLYHQDEFSDSDVHTHIKFKSLIHEEDLEKIFSILVKYHVINEKDKQDFIQQYHFRYEKVKKELDEILSEPGIEKRKIEKSIIYYITKCEDNDKLAFIHQYLASISETIFPLPQEKNHAEKFSWQATNKEGHIAPANKSWAVIEKAIMLQMAHNVKKQVSQYDSEFAGRYAKQLAETHTFFSTKHKLRIDSKHADRKRNSKQQINSAYGVFRDAKKNDQGNHEIDAKYRKFFKMK